LTPNSPCAIPREASLKIDLRSLNRAEFDQATKEIIQKADEYADEERCEVTSSVSEDTNPMPCSDEVIATIKQATEAMGYSYRVMPSRAGHDTQNMAKLARVGMIFVPSRGGISHAPEEWTDFSQAHRGVEVLEKSLIQLANTRVTR
jgi:acetylornithine deacetylase/succinyl-diaminopimelate desuccinylase-like protein